MTWYDRYRILLVLGGAIMALLILIGYTLAVMRFYVSIRPEEKERER
jgi:hypothetical protein